MSLTISGHDLTSTVVYKQKLRIQEHKEERRINPDREKLLCARPFIHHIIQSLSSTQTQVLLSQVIYEETESPISKVKLLQMVTAAMKLKYACSWEEKL